MSLIHTSERNSQGTSPRRKRARLPMHFIHSLKSVAWERTRTKMVTMCYSPPHRIREPQTFSPTVPPTTAAQRRGGFVVPATGGHYSAPLSDSSSYRAIHSGHITKPGSSGLQGAAQELQMLRPQSPSQSSSSQVALAQIAHVGVCKALASSVPRSRDRWRSSPLTSAGWIGGGGLHSIQ